MTKYWCKSCKKIVKMNCDPYDVDRCSNCNDFSNDLKKLSIFEVWVYRAIKRLTSLGIIH